jgi:hypothetical protein
VAQRRLLVVEDAELEVRALGAKLVKNGREMGKLRTGNSLSHGNAPTQEA